MNEPILFGLGMIALMVIWQFMVRRTALDHFRDRLFDLRESVREYYLKNNIGLEDKTYAELRRMLNCQIRFLEEASFVNLVVWNSEMHTHRDVEEASRLKLENSLQTDDADLAKFIKKVRSKSYRHVLNYIVYSSLGLTAICYTLMPFVLIGLVVIASLSFSKGKISKSFNFSKSTLSKSVIVFPQRMIPIEGVESASCRQVIPAHAC